MLAVCAAAIVAMLAMTMTTTTDASAQEYPAPGPEVGVMRIDGINPYAPNQLIDPGGPFDVFVANPEAFGGDCPASGPWYGTIGLVAIVDDDFIDLLQFYQVNNVDDVPGFADAARSALNARADQIGVGDQVLTYWSTDGCAEGEETTTITGLPVVTSGPLGPVESGTDITMPVIVLASLSAVTAAMFIGRRRGLFGTA